MTTFFASVRRRDRRRRPQRPDRRLLPRQGRQAVLIVEASDQIGGMTATQRDAARGAEPPVQRGRDPADRHLPALRDRRGPGALQVRPARDPGRPGAHPARARRQVAGHLEGREQDRRRAALLLPEGRARLARHVQRDVPRDGSGHRVHEGPPDAAVQQGAAEGDREGGAAPAQAVGPQAHRRARPTSSSSTRASRPSCPRAPSSAMAAFSRMKLDMTALGDDLPRHRPAGRQRDAGRRHAGPAEGAARCFLAPRRRVRTPRRWTSSASRATASPRVEPGVRRGHPRPRRRADDVQPDHHPDRAAPGRHRSTPSSSRRAKDIPINKTHATSLKINVAHQRQDHDGASPAVA